MDLFIWNAIERPTVVGLLRDILTQYPDNGQIIKELVQNAEDAGATEVILTHYQKETTSFPAQRGVNLQRFFKGPALRLYNNAEFTEFDWQGIRRLKDSIKKKDPLRIGQFGLGFKSVFHITDYVMIVSGRHVLFMDPSEPEDIMCGTLLLEKLTSIVPKEVCLELWGDHLSAGDLINGYFPATIFWFPLRQKASGISATIYNADRVTSLFHSFRIEAPGCLTFLKCLEKLCLKRKYENGSSESLIEVALQGPDIHEIRTKRRTFRQDLKEYVTGSPSGPLICKYNMTVRTTTAEGQAEQNLYVLHYVPHGEPFTPLSHGQANKDHTPHVGIAASMGLTGQAPVQQHPGQIFCFLPLPPDPSNDTGLPVQIHGFFHLSQNRRHVKWRTGEGGEEADVQWNEELVAKTTTKAYILLLMDILQSVIERKVQVDCWYRVLPKVQTTAGRWRTVTSTIWQELKDLPIFYTEAMDCMIKPSEAASINSLKYVREDLSKAVTEALSQCRFPLVSVEEEILNCLTSVGVCPISITPKLLLTELKTSADKVHQWTRDFRLRILEYLLSDWEIIDLNGIPLLPLQNGSWATFSQFESPVYMCTKEEAGVFVGLEAEILSVDLPTALHESLRRIAEKRRTQLIAFHPETHTRRLLCTSISFVKKRNLAHNQVNEWLQLVWTLLQKVRLDTVKDLELVPATIIPECGSLLPLCSAIIREDKDCRLSEASKKALTCLTVTVISQVPSFVTHWELYNYFERSDTHGVTKALNKIAGNSMNSQNKLQESFNSNISEANIEGLCQVLSADAMTTPLKNLLKGLYLFKARDSNNSLWYTSINRCNKIAPNISCFPVNFPETLIIAESEKTKQLAYSLGAVSLTVTDMFLLSFEKQGLQQMELNKLAEYALNSVDLLKSTEVRRKLQESRFVLTEGMRYLTPGETYDPEDPYREALLGVDCYPEHSASKKHLLILRELGMKTVLTMPQEQLISVGKQVSGNRLEETQLRKKVIALFQAINNRQDCKQVCLALNHIPCVYGVSSRPERYPDSLNWATSRELLAPSDVKSYIYKDICGSEVPLIWCNDIPGVAEAFGWSGEPDLEKVVKHLCNIISTYRPSEFKYLELIKSTYRQLAQHSEKNVIAFLKGVPSAFTEHGFMDPNLVYISPNEEDLNLTPYAYPLLLDLREHENFFMYLGCHQCQTTDLYLSVIKRIQHLHKGVGHLNHEHDRSLVVSMLRKMQKKLKEMDTSQLLIPIETEDGSLKFAEAAKCSYSPEACDWLDSEELGVNLVHSSVDFALAESLGVESLKKHMLAGEESFMEWGQYEPLTTRLKNLLREYRDGLAIFKEMVQNADDAGAQSVSFLYDERLNEDAQNKLLSSDLKGFQGPALWVHNDASFSEVDFNNLRKLGGGTKEYNSTKIGKFGLGFSSVYNLTDLPSFVSGSNYVIFDPHLCYVNGKNKSPGIRYNFVTERNSLMLKKMGGQFKPFKSVFGCDIQNSGSYEGTLFRLPLRTPKQALVSDICSHSYQRSSMEQLLEKFSHIIGEILLYMQNVKEVNVYHLKEGASSPNEKVLLMRSTRQTEEIASLHSNMLVKVSLNENPVESIRKLFDANHIWNGETLQESTVAEVTVEYTEEAKNVHLSSGSHSVHWLTSWHTGVGPSCRLAEELRGKALPLGAVSVPVQVDKGSWTPLLLKELPLGFYKECHMHCFLPLPVQTCFPVQINGFFEVAPDRTSLVTRTEDDCENPTDDWNITLMRDALTAAYQSLLQTLYLKGFNKDCKYYHLWPLVEEIHDALGSELAYSFYDLLVEKDCPVFRDEDEWVPFSQCLFLEENFHRTHVTGEYAFQFMKMILKDSTYKVMELPKKIECGFSGDILEKIITPEKFFVDYFIPNMINKDENQEVMTHLTLYLLDQHPDTARQHKTRIYIPTLPSGKLKRVDELIDPSSKIAAMYEILDERFPQELFVSGAHRKGILIELGMMAYNITKNMLYERTTTVQNLACAQCGSERSAKIIRYLANMKEELDHDVFKVIRDTSFLPVMARPKDWPVTWKGDSCVMNKSEPCKKHIKTHPHSRAFSPPYIMCLPHMKILAGSTHVILDSLDSFFSESHQKLNVYSALGMITIANKISPDTVIRQLNIFSKESDNWSSVKEQCHQIYQHLEKRIQKSIQLTHLSNLPILITSFGFVKPIYFTLSMEVNCAPDLFSVEAENLGTYMNFMKSLGISKNIDPQLVFNILIGKQNKHQNDLVSGEAVTRMSKLLHLLLKEISNTSFELDLSLLCLPDAEGHLTPIRELCINDGVKLKYDSVKYLNDDILLSQKDLKMLGLKTKSSKFLEESCSYLNFGQNESLVTRLNNILKDYPCDSGIMKEMLQNADDAGATEISFIKDFRFHSCEKVFDEKYAPLQGPALCVYNNACFQEKDLKGIQDLGSGSKMKDPASTGQYGIGFNAVYHLTDAPSFLTRSVKPIYKKNERETLCFFDPHCWYVPQATDQYPGVQYMNLEELRKAYPDSFLGYLDGLILQEEGTVFRLPLRTRSDSRISKSVMTISDLERKIEEFKNEMKMCLPFLRNVRRISIKHIDSSGECINEYTVEAHVEDEDVDKIEKLKTMIIQRRQSLTQEDKFKNYFHNSYRTAYKMTIKDSAKKVYQWYIIQQIGAETGERISLDIHEAFSNFSLNLLPHAGIAVLLESNSEESRNLMTTSCYLPLPAKSGLPFCVNGHFALNSARRDLWTGDDVRVKWNLWLMKEVLVPAAVEAVDHAKQHIFSGSGEPITCHMYKEKQKKYYCILPDKKDVAAQWKSFPKWFYEHVKKKQIKLFDTFTPYEDVPVESPRTYFYLPWIKDSNHDQEKGTLTWHSFTDEKDHFPLYFCEKEGDDSHFVDAHFVGALKRLGMKIGSNEIKTRLTIAEVDFCKLTPDCVLNFFLSWTSDYPDRCAINVEEHISKTPFLSLENACAVLKYLLTSEKFLSHIENFPLLVTEDGYLHVFSQRSPRFISEYVSVLPHSKEEFVNKKMAIDVQSVLELLFEKKVVKSLTLQDLSSRLEKNINPSLKNKSFKVQWENEKPLCNEWLTKFWEFVISDIRKTFPNQDIAEAKEYLLTELGEWALYPMTENEMSYLTPISKAVYVLHNGNSEKLILGSLKLPHTHKEFLILGELELAASLQNPEAVLETLIYHKDVIHEVVSSSSVNTFNTFKILEYFGEKIMKKHQLSSKQLRNIPLYEDINGKYESIGNKQIIVPKTQNIPIQNFVYINERNLVFVMKMTTSKYLECLYNYLDSSCLMGDLEIYANYILMNMHDMSTDERERHIHFLRDQLSRIRDKDESSWEKDEELVISQLRRTPFISLNGSLKKASFFYDSFNDVFKAMGLCNLPDKWSTLGWLWFLKLAGMKHKITSDMFLQYIKSLSARDPAVEEKSKTLLEYLFSHLQDLSHILDEIRKVEFLVPFKDNSLGVILSHFETSSGLVSFSKSYPKRFENLLWSTGSILPSYVLPHKDTNGVLISNMPPEDLIFEHIQNLCKELSKEPMKARSLNSHVMKSIYDYLSERDQSFLQRIVEHDIPIIHIPGKSVCVSPRLVVQSVVEEIVPYLYKAPFQYGAYFPVFEKLGIEKEGTAKTYATILAEIHTLSKGEKLNPEEVRCMKMALEGMLSNKSHLKELKNANLFLPTKAGRLELSSNIYVVDRPYLERVIGKSFENSLLVEFSHLKIYEDESSFVSLLPEHLRPTLLSSVVEQELVEGGKELIPCPLLETMEEGLGSMEFKTAVLRIFDNFGPILSQQQKQHILQMLESICLKAVSELRIRYKFQGTELDSKDTTHFRYWVQDDLNNALQNITVFFRIPVQEEYVALSLPFAFKKLLNRFGYANDIEMWLGKICMLLKQPREIHTLLDSLGLKRYHDQNIPNYLSAFSFEIGSYLDVDFIHLLDNELCLFNKGELVAMKKYDSGEGQECEDEDIFIIVKVMQNVTKSGSPIYDEYEVNTGSETEPIITVKAHHLYKFIRQREVCKDLVCNDSITDKDSITDEDEESVMKAIKVQVIDIWKVKEVKERKHLLRRLMLKWHPDKNPTKSDLATRVMQYIQSLLGRLERGELIPEDDNHRTCHETKPSTFYDEVFRSPPKYYREPSPSSRGAGFSRRPSPSTHSHWEKAKMPDRREALKWMKQAEHDLGEAESRRNGSPCWITYMCHQASEKSLKAVLYLEDRDTAQQYQSGSLCHSLTAVASRLSCNEIRTLAGEMETRVGFHTHMRYPTSMGAPCERYTQSDAEFMLEKAALLFQRLRPRF